METFKVAIVGGSVTGLAIALHLEKLGIDYIIIEAYGHLAPQVGASIGLAPNGLKIIEQLGCYEEYKDISVPVSEIFVRDDQGRHLWTHRVLEPMYDKYGYNVLFTERRKFLQILERHVQHKERIFLNQRVESIEQDGDKVQIHTKENRTFVADICIGTDGVHSTVRREMWRMASKVDPSYFGENPGKDVPTEYGCVFGISNPTNDIKAGQNHFLHTEGTAIGTMTATDNSIYWFLFFKMPKAHYGLDFPRYSKAEEVELAQKFTKAQMSETTTFGEIYENTRISQMTALPHHCFDKWHFGRVMTLGDACHKMNPIAGQGACTALESVAALCDELHDALQSHGGRLSYEQADALFARVTEIRRPRATDMVHGGQLIQKFSLWGSRIFKWLDYLVLPYIPTSLFVIGMNNACKGSYVSRTLPSPSPRASKTSKGAPSKA